MNGAVAFKSKPNHLEKNKTIIIYKKTKKNDSLTDKFESIDNQINKLEEKYVTPHVFKDKKKEEKLIIDHYILRTNKNTKSLESNLELYNYHGKINYYGLSDFIEFCNTWGFCFNKIEKLYLDKMYLYALQKGRINELKEIEDIFSKKGFEKILIQKSLNKSRIALNVKRIYIQDIIESIRNKNYDEAIDKVIYYSNNFIENYLTNKEREKLYILDLD